MKNFLSSKNTFTIIILWSLVGFLLAIIGINIKSEEVVLFPTIVLLLVCGLIVWILLDTRYVIKNGNLYYRSGPFRGRIAIEKIRKIEYFSGYLNPTTVKPALDFKGYIISYNSFDDMYVSPQKANLFIDELLKINPNIEVVVKK